jgi:hypothetical protein
MTRYIKRHFATSSEFRTVCEVLREIYWATEDEELRTKVIEAERMTKRMDAKLREHNDDWDVDEWEKIDSEVALIRAKQRWKKYEEAR